MSTMLLTTLFSGAAALSIWAIVATIWQYGPTAMAVCMEMREWAEFDAIPDRLTINQSVPAWTRQSASRQIFKRTEACPLMLPVRFAAA